MAAWRREFLARFPEYQTEAQAAYYAGSLMPKPLFFILRDALDAGDTEVARKVITYSVWLIERHLCAAEPQEDLLGEITNSRRVNDFLRCLTPAEFEVVKEYCLVSWWPQEQRNAKMKYLTGTFGARRLKADGEDRDP